MTHEPYLAARYLHFIGIFLFLLAHRVSVGVSFKLRGERDRGRIAALLELSASTYPAMAVGFLLILGSAAAMAFLAQWWRFAWFWAALILFFALAGVMTPLATVKYGQVRAALGLKLPMGAKPKKGAEEKDLVDEEIAKIISSVNPWLLSAVGFGGVAALALLMMVKPV